uniref:G_PROTEIN_RECEP_F1_2 domain-containing protein n=1 Tax=Strongyloides venezuelensis TaxID=75913 RepID=A0A0K0G5A7_STRVS
MTELIVPDYLYPTIKFQEYQAFILNCLAILPNLYFLHRSIYYKEFNNRKYFKYMTIIMSSEYVFVSVIHALFNGYLIIGYFTGSQIFVKFCSKCSIFDIKIRHILIATPFYLHFFRFWLLIFNKKKKCFVLILAIIIISTTGPLLYMVYGQYFEINIYFLPQRGCGYQIFSNMPFFIEIMYFNFFILIALPFILIFINYLIYRSVVKKLYNINRAKVMKCKRILKAILFQGFFTSIFEVPPTVYLLYFAITRNVHDNLDITVHFIYFTGYNLYVFFTVVGIKDLRVMMLKDIGINNTVKPSFIYNSPYISKFFLK